MPVTDTTPHFEQATITSTVRRVHKDWIDYNGHLNMAFYNVLFDKGTDDVYDRIGIGADYVTARSGSVFTMEVHVNYLSELSLDDPVRIEFQLLDRDAKRLHFFQSMYHATDGYLAATSEQLALHMDMTERRSAPFPDDILPVIDALFDAQKDLPRPEQAGARIGIRRR